MRLAGALLIASIVTLWACAAARAQSADRPVQIAEAAAKAAAAKRAPAARPAPAANKAPVVKAAPAPKKAPAAAQPGRDIYPNMPLGERVGIQFDLAWSRHYNGLINGEFTERSIAAVRAFQRDQKSRESGVLTPPERAALAALSKEKQEQVGWRMVDDKPTGAQLGLPTRHVPNISRARTGTRWSSAQGQIQVETFRIREPGATLATVFEQQKKEPANRRIEVNLLRNEFFIVSGTQGLKKFYVRAEIRDLEIRGMTVLWDPATAGIMDPVVVVMSSAFAPFSGSGLGALMAPARRKVEYGTGIVVTADGHIITDRQLTDDCNVIEVSGHGDAQLLASDSAGAIALLRVFGASELSPLAINEGGRDGDLTLVGIADPQLQAGGRAASTVVARHDGGALQPAPQLGFAGAAALDAQGRFFGMAALKTPLMASAGKADVPLPQAALVAVPTIRTFLETQGVMPATGRSGVDAVKAAVVRVICVRR